MFSIYGWMMLCWWNGVRPILYQEKCCGYIYGLFFLYMAFFLERRRRTALHYIKKRKGKIPENTKQHKDNSTPNPHRNTHLSTHTPAHRNPKTIAPVDKNRKKKRPPAPLLSFH